MALKAGYYGLKRRQVKKLDMLQPIYKLSDQFELEDNELKLNSDIMNATVYGFEINGNESDPDKAVTYLRDAIGMSPAHIEYDSTNEVWGFNYGDWADAFFMPRPCMLKSDGTVDYYLSAADYSKKEDGTTSSDVANTSYDGNAMMEWGQNGKKIWLKIEPVGTKSARVFISDQKVDEGFNDYAFHDCTGKSADHFYTAIYNGSVISEKMRSLSGQAVSKGLQGTEEITAARKNNAGSSVLWDIDVFADRLLINLLLVLMSKSLDMQTKFGQGATASGTEAINATFTTGVHNTKGLFYGTNSGTVAANTFGNVVKCFGMENWYGYQWRRTQGLILRAGKLMYKLTYGKEDGSNVVGYNTTGENYKTAGDGATGTSGNYIDAMKFMADGMFPATLGGSSSTYYCDASWYNNSDNRFALFGAVSNVGGKAGGFTLTLNDLVSYANWYYGACLSCKPLAA